MLLALMVSFIAGVVVGGYAASRHFVAYLRHELEAIHLKLIAEAHAREQINHE